MKRIMIMMFVTTLLLSCGESVEPTPVAPEAKKAFEKNATDAAGVAEGNEQVSPFGKPAH